MFKHVLVPLDGSTLAETALRYAREITVPGGVITLLTSVDVPEYTVTTFYATGVLAEASRQQASIESIVPHAREYLCDIAKTLEEDGWLTRVEAVIGDAASTIIEHATKEKADVIVMSTHGRSGINRWLFGSVTQKVLQQTTCPVLVVPNEKRG
jgi:nucleotide-binding universal stress UspA family protein